MPSTPGADEFPKISENQIIIEMGDGSHFVGPLRSKVGIPPWLQPRQKKVKDYNVFTLKQSGNGFTTNIDFIKPQPSSSRPKEHNTTYGPRYAEIFRAGEHLTAKNFRFYERPSIKEEGSNAGTSLPRNTVYVSFKKGKIYASILEPHDALDRNNRERYSTPGITPIVPLTASAASASQILQKNHQADHMNNHGIYPTQGHNGMVPLNVLAPSSSEMMLQHSQAGHMDNRGIYLLPGHNGMEPLNAFTHSVSQTMLPNYQPDHMDNSGRYTPAELTRGHPVTAWSASGSKRMLDPQEVDHWQYRGGYSSPRFPRMESLTASTALASSGSQRSSSGFPEVSEDHIVVEMGDDSHFHGSLKREGPEIVPSWLAHQPGTVNDYHAFIIKKSEARFTSKLIFITAINNHEHNLNFGPKYAEILSGSDHLTARNFVVLDPKLNREGKMTGIMLFVNYVYVSSKNGKIYSSRLEPHHPDHRIYRARVQREGSPEWGQLTDLPESHWISGSNRFR